MPWRERWTGVFEGSSTRASCFFRVSSTTPQIITFEERPFGNNYFATETCGGAPYDSDVRHCWAAMCVDAETPADECFEGAIVPQHGQQEADVDRMESCAKSMLYGDDWEPFWAFLSCMEAAYEKDGLAATGACAQTVASSTKAKGVNALDDLETQLWACYNSTDGDAAQLAEAQKTFDHDAVPYLEVAGAEVDPDDVVAAVCAAYAGPVEHLPEVCVEKLRGANKATTTRAAAKKERSAATACF